MASNRRYIGWIIGSLGLIGIVAYLAKPAPVPVETAIVTRGNLQVSVEEDGETRAHDRFVVASPIAGRLQRIEWHEGDTVSPKSILAVVNPAPLDIRGTAEARAGLQAAEALYRAAERRVAQVQGDYEQAQRDGDRARELGRQGILARQEVERAGSTVASLEQELKAARFRAEAAAKEAQKARATLVAAEGNSDGEAHRVLVRAPAAGRVLRILEKSEHVVTQGTPLIVIGDPRKIEVVVDVLSTDAVRIRPGARVYLSGWGGDRILRASVRTVEPYAFTKVSALGIEEQRVNVVADFVEDWKPLGDGYRVDARIITWEGNQVLKIPVSSLFREGEEWAVFQLDDGRVRRTRVRVGHRNANEAEILEGLAEGALVVLHPPNRLRDGTRVKTS